MAERVTESADVAAARRGLLDPIGGECAPPKIVRPTDLELRGTVAISRLAWEKAMNLRIGLEWYMVPVKVDEPDPAQAGILTMADITLDVLALAGASKYAPLLRIGDQFELRLVPKGKNVYTPAP